MGERKFEVCIHPDIEDTQVSADCFFYCQKTGWLTFSNFKEEKAQPHTVFAPGKWLYFREVS